MIRTQLFFVSLMSILSNFQIEKVAKLCKTHVLTCCIDELAHMHPGLLVYNYSTTTSDDGGSHWAALCCHGSNAYCVDSYGRPPLKEVVAFANKHGLTLYTNAEQIQDDASVDCGWFALGFCLFFAKLAHKDECIQDWLDLFTSDYRANDFELHAWWKKHTKLKI